AEGYELDEAVRQVCIGVESYHDLLTEKTTSMPEPIADARRILKRPWSPFSEPVVAYLRNVFLNSNSFPKKSIYGQLTKAYLYRKYMDLSDQNHEAACYRGAIEALALFMRYPMRAALPE